MDDTLRIIAIWAHILGIALFVGPQFFLAFAWVPASRGIADLTVRTQAMRTITRRFGYVGGAGLLLIVLAGGYLIGSWRDYYTIPADTGLTELRYGVLFVVKMVVLLVMLAVVGVHTFLVGPRLLRKLEAEAAGQPVTDAELRSARMASMSLSILGLVLALTMMVLGVMMNTTTFSFHEV